MRDFTPTSWVEVAEQSVAARRGVLLSHYLSSALLMVSATVAWFALGRGADGGWLAGLVAGFLVVGALLLQASALLLGRFWRRRQIPGPREGVPQWAVVRDRDAVVPSVFVTVGVAVALLVTNGPTPLVWAAIVIFAAFFVILHGPAWLARRRAPALLAHLLESDAEAAAAFDRVRATYPADADLPFAGDDADPRRF